MSIVARLTEAETDAVMEFLISEARTDGQRAAALDVETRPTSHFLLAQQGRNVSLEEVKAPPRLILVQNFFEELRQLAP
jgi:hypothetical protein